MAKAAEIAGRRARVAAGLLAGRSYRQMAGELGCGLGTVERDAAAVLAEWQAARVRDRGEQVSVELARLEAAAGALWERVIVGEETATAEWRRLAERRAKLMGLDAPPRLSDEEVALLRAVEVELAHGARLRAEIDARGAADAEPGAGNDPAPGAG